MLVNLNLVEKVTEKRCIIVFWDGDGGNDRREGNWVLGREGMKET